MIGPKHLCGKPAPSRILPLPKKKKTQHATFQSWEAVNHCVFALSTHCVIYFCYLKTFFFFNIFEGGRAEGQRERDRENPKRSVQSVQSPPRDSISQTMRSWPEPKWSQTLNRLSHPGAPIFVTLRTHQRSTLPSKKNIHSISTCPSAVTACPGLGLQSWPALRPQGPEPCLYHCSLCLPSIKVKRTHSRQCEKYCKAQRKQKVP